MPITLTPEGLATIIGSIVATIVFVVRSNVVNNNKRIQATLDADKRDAALRDELKKDASVAQLKLENLQEKINAQLLQERNATILEHHKLNDRLITAQDNMLKLQQELRLAEQKERESKARADILLGELNRTQDSLASIQKQLANVERQLIDANTRITILQRENDELKAEMGKIKKSTTQPLKPVDVTPPTNLTSLPSVT